MATSLICLKISPVNVKQLSVKTSSAKRSSVSVEGSLTLRWSKKYLRWFETVFHFPFQLNFMKGLLVYNKRLLLLVDS